MITGGTGQQGEHYRLGNDITHYMFGIEYYIPVGAIGEYCIELLVRYYVNDIELLCAARFDICPPRPCQNNTGCNLEAYQRKLNCLNNGALYSVDMAIKGASYPCVKVKDLLGNVILEGPYTNPLGSFNQDVTMVLYECNTPFTCGCTPTNCYKVQLIRGPKDCNRDDLRGGTPRSRIAKDEFSIVPNPVISGEFLIKTNLINSEINILNSSGKLIFSTLINKSEYLLNLEIQAGIYFVRYKNSDGDYSVVKLIKL